MSMNKRIVMRGGGDLATAVAQKLLRSGFEVIICELDAPKTVRRTVALSNAIYEGTFAVEDVKGIYTHSLKLAEQVLKDRDIPILTLPEDAIMAYFKPFAFVDATLSKRKVNYDINYVPIVIGLGPNINAGKEAHIVIETARGHDLGRLIVNGEAKVNTHIPGDIGGYTHERVMHAPCSGKLMGLRKIGDSVSKGEIIATVDGQPVVAKISGVIRGMIHEAVPITEGLKLGDIDPRNDPQYCYTISDKGRNIAGGVLEAILILMQNF